MIPALHLTCELLHATLDTTEIGSILTRMSSCVRRPVLAAGKDKADPPVPACFI
jgi:hypothetical protein